MKPNIANYLNIFQFLQDYYTWRKEMEPSFSYASWSKELGIKNKSYLRFVTLGKRPLRAGLVDTFKVLLFETESERRNFELLCLYSQSRTSEERKVLGHELISVIRNDALQVETEAHHNVMMSPLCMMIRTLLTFNDLKKTALELTRILDVSQSEVLEALDQLQAMHMVVKNGEVYESVADHVRVADKFHGMGLDHFYRESLKAAANSLNLNSAQRRMRSWYLAIPEDQMVDIVSKMEREVREVVLSTDSDSFQGKRLYQVLFTAFPVSK